MSNDWTPRPLSKTGGFVCLPDRLIVFDGVCNLCTGWVKFVIKRDPDVNFYFVSAQSDLGQRLLVACGLNKTDFNSNIYIEQGIAYLKMDAVINIVGHLGDLWGMIKILNIIPMWERNWIYDRIALNRYHFFGRSQYCLIPDDTIKNRFIETGES